MISVACSMGAPWAECACAGKKKSPGRRLGPATGAHKPPLVATGRASPPCPRIIHRSSEPIRAGKFPALAELVVLAGLGGDFRVPNWTTAPLRCAVVL